MTRLRQGLQAVVGLERVVVVDLDGGIVRVLPLDAGEALVAAGGAGPGAPPARGTPPLTPDPARTPDASLADLVEDRDDPVDSLALRRLAALDRALAGDGPDGPDATRALAAVERAQARRSCVNRVLGQRPALPETVVRRVLLPGAAAPAVLVLGDDDFTGLALAAAGEAQRVVVHDIDPLLLDVYAAALAEAGLRCELVEHDLREALPAPAAGAFGAVHVTIPDSREGASLVLSRAVTCLAPGGLVVASARGASVATLEPVLRRCGLRVELQASGFHRYYGPGCRLDSDDRDLLCLRADGSPPPIAHDAAFLPDRLYGGLPDVGAPALSYTLEAIEDARLTRAAFLHLLLSRVEGLPPGLVHEEGDTTGFAAVLPGQGFALLHADRRQRALQAVVSPIGAPPQQRLLALLHAAHKRDAESIELLPDERCFVGRVR